MEVAVVGPEAEATAAWAAVVETDRMLRLAGAPPVRVRLAEDADGEVVPAGTMLGPAGLRHAFEDTSLSWVQGRRLSFVRRVEGPLLQEIEYEAVLKPGVAGGVVPSVRLKVTPRMGAGGWLLSLYTRGVQAGWRRELEALPAPGSPAAGTPRVRRPLDVTTRAALSRWSERGARPALRARVERWLKHAPQRVLGGLRPLELARGWSDGDGLGAVLDDLIEAAAAGALEIWWSVRCPRCGHDGAQVDGLNGLPEVARCPACGAVRAVDLVDTVEAVLAAPAWLRGAEPCCPSTAARLPDTLAAALLGPGEEAELALALDPGPYRLIAGAGAEAEDGLLTVVARGTDSANWTPGGGDVELGHGVLRLHNPTGRRYFVRVVAETMKVPRLPAFSLLTRPWFQARLGGQAPAPDTVLEVADATVLFTDLTDTSDYFARMGDRAAVRHVRMRLDAVEAEVRRCGGVRVKTLGDGILALFSEPAGAVQAALGMLQGSERGHPGEPQLRMGIARGSILTEHTDAAGLDCFGATVNCAARAVYGAKAGTVRLARSVLPDAGGDGTGEFVEMA